MITFADRNRRAGRGYWHEFGTEFTDPAITAVEAGRQAGLDYEVTKRQIITRNAKGHTFVIPNQFAVVSEYGGQAEAIAIVGREFEPVQNMHLAEMLDASGLTSAYAMDVAGKTQDGRTVFWALKARQALTINGDEYRDHWLITDGKDGNRALTIALTPVRTVCSNALAMAVAGATVKVGIQHTSAAKDELRWWLGIAPKLEAASRKAHDVLWRFADIEVTAAQVDEVLEAAYPKPKVRGRAQLYATLPELELDTDAGESVEKAFSAHGTEAMRVLAKREFARDLFTSYADDPEEANIAGTLLGIVNAVADVENHRAPTNKRENAALSNLYGPRYAAQAGAIKAAMAIAK